MGEDLELEGSEFLPLRDVVYNTLRNGILRGSLKPGDRLMEMHLANKLGVSRTPVREAIRMLEQEGLAVMIPRKGAQVAKMTEKDLQDVLEIRDALDELAVRMACSRMTDGQLLELKEALRAFEEAALSKDVRRIVEADEAFHNVIYRMADNPKLEGIVNNLKEQMYRYRYEYIKEREEYGKLIEEHRGIAEGFERRDSESVGRIMHEHLENQILAVQNVIRKQE